MRAAIESTPILLVEDEPLIALDLCEVLERAGYAVLGPAATLAEASALLSRRDPGAAIIDIVLRDGPCQALAHQLKQRGIPFLIHSAAGRDDGLPSGFEDAPWITKPAAADRLLALLRRLTGPLTAR